MCGLNVGSKPCFELKLVWLEHPETNRRISSSEYECAASERGPLSKAEPHRKMSIWEQIQNRPIPSVFKTSPISKAPGDWELEFDKLVSPLLPIALVLLIPRQAHKIRER